MADTAELSRAVEELARRVTELDGVLDRVAAGCSGPVAGGEVGELCRREFGGRCPTCAELLGHATDGAGGESPEVDPGGAPPSGAP